MKQRCSPLMRYGWLVALLLNGALSAQAAAVRSSTPLTAFVDVSVIPMDSERVLSHQTVVVRGDRILALGPASEVQVPTGAQSIDGRGKYLLPGLADMHVHPFMLDSFDQAKFARYLAHGVTTVRDMHSGGTVSEALRVKRELVSGALVGPRLYTAGDLTIPRSTVAGPAATEVEVVKSDFNLATIADSIVALKRAGHDFVKLYAFPHPAYDSVVAAAGRVGLRVAGHVPAIYGALSRDEVGVEQVLHDRWASIEHLTGYLGYMTGGFPDMVSAVMQPEWMTPLLDTAAWTRPGYQWDTVKLRTITTATQQAGVWNCPTLTVVTMLTRFLEVSSEPASTWTKPHDGPPWLRNWIDFIFLMVKALQNAGAGLLLGTDDFGTAPDELRLLVEEAGLTPYQALSAGTRNAAIFLGTLDSTGTVTVGKRADLLLLDGNPLQNIRAAASTDGVMVGGQWLSRADLDRRLGGEP